MRRILIPTIALALLAVSCHKGQKETATFEPMPEKPTASAMLTIDSVVVDTTFQVPADHDEFYEDQKPLLRATVHVIDSTQWPILANAYYEWLSEKIFSSYEGNIHNINEMMLQHYDSRCNEYGEYTPMGIEYHVRKAYETPYLVSFVYFGYDYALGGAHGCGYCEGVTFRKSDGKVFGKNMFRGPIDNDLLKRGLKEYFNVKGDSQLMEELMIESPYSAEYLPQPHADPWLEEDGIHVVYQPYEIACYANGMPAFVIPMKGLQKHLTPVAWRLFNH